MVRPIPWVSRQISPDPAKDWVIKPKGVRVGGTWGEKLVLMVGRPYPWGFAGVEHAQGRTFPPIRSQGDGIRKKVELPDMGDYRGGTFVYGLFMVIRFWVLSGGVVECPVMV